MNSISETFSKHPHTKLPLDNAQYFTWLKSMPKAEASQINDKLHYMDDYFRGDGIHTYVKKDVSFYDYIASVDTVSDNEIAKYNSAQPAFDHEIPIPVGYKTVIQVSDAEYNADKDYNWDKANDIVKVALVDKNDTITSVKNHIVTVNLSELKKMNSNAKMPLMTMKTSIPNSIFVLTGFSISYNKKEKTDLSVSLSGYLFKK